MVWANWMKVTEVGNVAKLLYFQWHSFMNRGIERALYKLELEYDTFFYQFTDWEKDDEFCSLFSQKIKSGAYCKVFSVNFAPLISNICEQYQIPYISWIYDCPLHIRNLKPLENRCNTVYFFDRRQAEEAEKASVNAKHMPLAVDTEVFYVHPGPEEQKKYSTDVSLVGKLYQTEYQYYIQPLNGYQRGYLEGIIQSQMKIYGGYLIPELITDELLADLNVSYGKASGNQVVMDRRELEFLLACETTGRERYLALALLSQHFKTVIYSTQKDERLTAADYKGYADYYKDMPYIFRLSGINLNITLKAIQTGIPLRVLDVMGCGGFVLTNYQEEIAEHFVNETDCAMYESLEDLYAKVQFYLKHDTERQRIAQSGMEKVRRDFTFEERLRKMLVDR